MTFCDDIIGNGISRSVLRSLTSNRRSRSTDRSSCGGLERIDCFGSNSISGSGSFLFFSRSRRSLSSPPRILFKPPPPPPLLLELTPVTGSDLTGD